MIRLGRKSLGRAGRPGYRPLTASIKKAYTNFGNPNQSFYYPKMALLGFGCGFGFVSWLVHFEIETEERKISFFRTTTRLGIQSNAIFNDIVRHLILKGGLLGCL